jgi:Ca2+-binding EF-hand superfamily protein
MKPPKQCSIFLAILMAMGSLSAEDGPSDPPKRAFGNGVLPQYLSVYDVNDDGALSVEEGQALRQDRTSGERITTFRKKWDTNRDGTISNAEREAAKAVIRQIIINRRSRRFAEVDTNDDEFLSKREFSSIAAVRSIDTSNPGTADDLFAHLDKDGDKQISKAEFLRSLDAAPIQAIDVTPTPPHPKTPVVTRP